MNQAWFRIIIWREAPKKVFCRLRRQNILLRDTSFLKFRKAEFQK